MSVRVPRPAARILLLDEAGRILLFRFDPADRPAFWCTPGGAVDPGESYAQAARRELREETGLDLDCGPELFGRQADFLTIERVEVTADERYFLVRAPHGEVDTGGHTALEQRVMTRWQWFDRAALAALDEPYFPEDLPEILDALEPAA